MGSVLSCHRGVPLHFFGKDGIICVDRLPRKNGLPVGGAVWSFLFVIFNGEESKRSFVTLLKETSRRP